MGDIGTLAFDWGAGYETSTAGRVSIEGSDQIGAFHLPSGDGTIGAMMLVFALRVPMPDGTSPELITLYTKNTEQG